MGLLRNIRSTAALVPWTAVIRTFHSSTQSRFCERQERSIHEIRCEPNSLTGSCMPLGVDLPWKFVGRPNGLRLETRSAKEGSAPYERTLFRIGTASFRLISTS